MAGDVCKVYIVKGFTESGYFLSPAERDFLLRQGSAARMECGGRTLIAAAASWSSYDTYGFGAEIFPNFEALHKYCAALDKLNWFSYFESETYIGALLEVNEPAAGQAIYALQIIHGVREAADAFSEAEINARLAQVAKSADSFGVRRILTMSPAWSDEDNLAVQILEWPGVEALVKQAVFEEGSEWLRYVSQRKILGVLAPSFWRPARSL
jgi:hypothetical protein